MMEELHMCCLSNMAYKHIEKNLGVFAIIHVSALLSRKLIESGHLFQNPK